MTGKDKDVRDTPDECADIARETDRAGDKYYSAMTSWLAQRKRRPDEAGKVLWLGRAYDRSLDLLINCFERLDSRRERIARKREHAAKLQTYLHKDIDYLQQAQTDEN